MANLSTQRNALATALRAAGRVVYAFPPAAPTGPALILVPGSPYITPLTIGGLNHRLQVRFDLTAMVNASDNQAALVNLETLMLAVFQSLPVDVAVGAWTTPTMVTVANSEMLTASLSIDLTTHTE